MEWPTFRFSIMSDIDESSETHHLPFQTPAGRLEELPLETDSSVDSEKEQRESPVLFRIIKRLSDFVTE